MLHIENAGTITLSLADFLYWNKISILLNAQKSHNHFAMLLIGSLKLMKGNTRNARVITVAIIFRTPFNKNSVQIEFASTCTVISISPIQTPNLIGLQVRQYKHDKTHTFAALRVGIQILQNSVQNQHCRDPFKKYGIL